MIIFDKGLNKMEETSIAECHKISKGAIKYLNELSNSRKEASDADTVKSAISTTSSNETCLERIMMRFPVTIPTSDLGTPRNDSFTNFRSTKQWQNSQALIEKCKLSNRINEMIGKTNDNDSSLIHFRLHVQNQAFNCNKPLLMAYSRYFQNRRFRRKLLLRESVKPSIFKVIYHWMLTDCASVQGKELLSILKAAEYMQIDELVQQCSSVLYDERIKDDAAFMLYLESQRLRLPVVKKVMLPRVGRFFLVVLTTREFLEMCIDDICMLLSSDAVGVNTEIEASIEPTFQLFTLIVRHHFFKVFMAAVRWLDFNWSDRSEHGLTLMSCVRFKLMPGWFLVLLNSNVVGNHRLQTIMGQPLLREIVEDALTCVVSYLYLNDQEVLRCQPQRVWLYDKHCNYHHFDFETRTCKEDITFERFSIYLASLGRGKETSWQNFVLLKQRDPFQVLGLKSPSHADQTNESARKLSIKPNKDRKTNSGQSADVSYFPITREFLCANEDFLTPMSVRDNCSPSSYCSEKFSKELHNFMDKEARSLVESLHGKLYVFGAVDHVSQHHKTAPPSHSTDRLASQTGIEKIPGSVNQHFGDEVLRLNGHKNSWEEVAFLPCGARKYHAAVHCGGLIYIIGGTKKVAEDYIRETVFEKSVWSFDPDEKLWNFVGLLPELRRYHAVVSVDVGFYVIGGEGIDGVPLRTVWFYCLKSKKWQQKAPLKEARYGLMATKFNDRVWVAGGFVSRKGHERGMEKVVDPQICSHDDKLRNGYAPQRLLADTVEYIDLAPLKESNKATYSTSKNRFALPSRLRMPRAFARFCVTSNDELYLVGGIAYNAAGALTSSSSVDKFNFQEDFWESHGDLRLPRHGHDVVFFHENILVIGGTSTFERLPFRKNEVYSLSSCETKPAVADLPWPLTSCSVASTVTFIVSFEEACK